MDTPGTLGGCGISRPRFSAWSCPASSEVWASSSFLHRYVGTTCLCITQTLPTPHTRFCQGPFSWGDKNAIKPKSRVDIPEVDKDPGKQTSGCVHPSGSLLVGLKGDVTTTSLTQPYTFWGCCWKLGGSSCQGLSAEIKQRRTGQATTCGEEDLVPRWLCHLMKSFAKG